MLDLIGRLANVAEGQSGHVTQEQANLAGATPEIVASLIHAQVAEPVIDGVFRLRGGGRHPFPRLYAHWLLLDPKRPGWERPLPQAGVASHRAAVRVHGLGDRPGPEAEFTAIVDPDGEVFPGIVLHQEILGAGDWQLVAGLPVTTPARTLADLILTPYADVQDLARIAAAILRRGLATAEELAAALDRCDPPDGGAKQLQNLLALQDEES